MQTGRCFLPARVRLTEGFCYIGGKTMNCKRIRGYLSVIAFCACLACVLSTREARADMMAPPSTAGNVIITFVALLPLIIAVIFAFILIASFCSEFKHQSDPGWFPEGSPEASEAREAQENRKHFRAVIGTMVVVSLSSFVWYMQMWDFNGTGVVISIVIMIAGAIFARSAWSNYWWGRDKKARKILLWVCGIAILLLIAGLLVLYYGDAWGF